MSWSSAAFAQTSGFSARLIDLISPPHTTSQALDFVRNLPDNALPGEVRQDVTEIVEVVDFRGSLQGQFSEDLPYPGGLRRPGDGESFLNYVEATVTIPPGRWQVGLGSDGGFLQLEGVRFFNEQNENGSGVPAGIGNDAIWHESIRTPSWTIGTINVPTTTTTRLTALAFENAEDDLMEIAIRDASSFEASLSGTHPQINPSRDRWQLLRHGALGWGVQTSMQPVRHIAGDGIVGREALHTSQTNEVFGPSQITPGVLVEVFDGDDFEQADSIPLWETFLAGDPAPSSSGVIPDIRWGSLIGFPQTMGSSVHTNQYAARVTGEMFVPTLVNPNPVVRFKDGNDDYAYLAIDLNGDGRIDGGPDGTEVLIDDPQWTSIDGADNGGSSIAFAIFSNLPAGGEHRRFEFRMSDHGNIGSGVLYWDQNASAPPFPASRSEPALSSHLVPNSALQVQAEELLSADLVASLGPRAEFDANANELQWDQVGLPPNPDDSVFRQIIDVDEAMIQLHLVGTPSEGFTVDLIDNTHVDAIVGTPAFDLPPGIWDTSRFVTNGQITFVRVPEPPTARVVILVGILAMAWRFRRGCLEP